jgi:hypothetical protein
VIEAIRRKITVIRSWFLEENAESLRQAKHNLWYIFVSLFMFSFTFITLFSITSFNAIIIGLSPLPAIILVAKMACIFSFGAITGIFFSAFLSEKNISSFNMDCDYALKTFYSPLTQSFFAGFIGGAYGGMLMDIGFAGTNTALLPQTLIAIGSIIILLIFASYFETFNENPEYIHALHRTSGYNLHIMMTLFAIIVVSCVSSLIFFIPIICIASLLIANTINMVKFNSKLVSFAKNDQIEFVRAIIGSTKPPEALIQKAALTAAKAGNKEIADFLMMRQRNGNGTFFQRAIALENIALVEYLLQNHLYDKNIYAGEYDFSSDYNILSSPALEPAILSAAKTGNVAIAAALIAAGANPSELAYRDNKTALQLAVENNHINLVKYLMFSKHVQFIELYTCLNQGYITRADAFEKSKQMLNMSLDDNGFCNLIRERFEDKYTYTTAKRRDEKTILEAKFDEIELGINNPNKLSETNKKYLQNLINEYKKTSNKPTEQLVARDVFSRSLLGISNLVNLKKPATFRYMQELIVGKVAGKINAKDVFLKLKTTTRFLLKKLNPDVVTRFLEYVGGPLQNFKCTQYKLVKEISMERYNESVKANEIKSIKEKEEFNAPQTDLKEEITPQADLKEGIAQLAAQTAQRAITLKMQQNIIDTLQEQLAAIGQRGKICIWHINYLDLDTTLDFFAFLRGRSSSTPTAASSIPLRTMDNCALVNALPDT